MSPDELGFIAAICAARDDYAPRLTFADWLDEHGQAERAELILVQCKLAEQETHDYRPGEKQWPAFKALQDCERELLKKDWRLFAPDFPLMIQNGWPDPGTGPVGRTTLPLHAHAKLLRGFIESITLTAADWLDHHAGIAWHPDHCSHYCPPTAQPIRTVKLTTELRVRQHASGMNYGFHEDPDGWRSSPKGITWPGNGGVRWVDIPRAMAAELCRERWPWLTVELPPEDEELHDLLAQFLQSRDFRNHRTARLIEGDVARTFVHPSEPLSLDPLRWRECHMELTRYLIRWIDGDYEIRAARCQCNIVWHTRPVLMERPAGRQASGPVYTLPL